MGMGEFNSDNHHIYYCGQKSLRRNGVALIVNRDWFRVVRQRRQRRIVGGVAVVPPFNVIVI